MRQGVAKASETVRDIRSAWVKEQLAHVENGAVTEFQVNLYDHVHPRVAAR